jgi:adenylate cyclase
MTQRTEDPSVVPQLGHFLPCADDALKSALDMQGRTQEGASPEKASRARLGQILVQLGSISANDLDSALLRQRMEWLRRSSLFAELTDGDLEIVARRVEELSLEPGQDLLVQGEQNDNLFILIRGQVEMFRISPEGERTILAARHPGDHLGEMSYASGQPPGASAQAVGPVSALRLSFEALTACIDQIPRLAKAFWEIASVRLQQISSLYEERSHRQTAAEKSLQHLYSFLELSEAKTVGSGIDGLIENLVTSASRLVEADRATLFLLDPDSQELWSKVAEGSGMKEIRIPAGVGVAGWVAGNGQMQNISDAYQDERFNPEVDRETGYRTQTILCAPIVNLQGETLGVVQAINKKGGAFDEEDERLFGLFSHQAAIAVENFNLYNRIMTNHHKMGVMLDIASTLNETIDLGSLIGKLVTKIMNVLGCDRCSFFVYDEKSDELWSLQAVGLEYQEIRFPASMGLAGHAAQSGETVNVEDAYKDIRFNPEFDRRSGFRTRSVLCVPLFSHDGRITSVVQAINKARGTFDQEDEELLRAISAQISMAVDNSKLHADTLGMKNYLEGVQTSISSAILTLDHEKNVVTANKAASTLLELDETTITGTPLPVLLGDGNDYVISLVDQVSASGSAAMQYDVLLRKPCGTEGTVNVNVLPLTTSGEDADGLVLIMEDVSSEKRVRSMLTRYMDKEIVDRVLDDPSQQTLGGQRSVASVLFCDIRDFTSIAEGLSAEGTMDLLNEYFGTMVSNIERQEGMLDKFIGDAMLAVFGLPFAREDDATRAVQCALAMRRSLETLNAARAKAGKAAIRNGIGINTGEVISGNVGCESRMGDTVIGDGVNLASRLEGLTKYYGTPVLVSKSTLTDLRDGFETRHVDQVIVKGRSRPVGIHEVLGEKGCVLPGYVDAFEEGFRLYQEQRFQEALKRFRAVHEEDALSRRFTLRCEEFLKSPPGDDWDGAWWAETK